MYLLTNEACKLFEHIKYLQLFNGLFNLKVCYWVFIKYNKSKKIRSQNLRIAIKDEIIF